MARGMNCVSCFFKSNHAEDMDHDEQNTGNKETTYCVAVVCSPPHAKVAEAKFKNFLTSFWGEIRL